MALWLFRHLQAPAKVLNIVKVANTDSYKILLHEMQALFSVATLGTHAPNIQV